MNRIKIVIVDEGRQQTPINFYCEQSSDDHDLAQVRATLKEVLSKSHVVHLSSNFFADVPSYLDDHVLVCLPLMNDGDEKMLPVCRINVQQQKLPLSAIKSALLEKSDLLNKYSIQSSYFTQISCDDYSYPQEIAAGCILYIGKEHDLAVDVGTNRDVYSLNSVIANSGSHSDSDMNNSRLLNVQSSFKPMLSPIAENTQSDQSDHTTTGLDMHSFYEEKANFIEDLSCDNCSQVMHSQQPIPQHLNGQLIPGRSYHPLETEEKNYFSIPSSIKDFLDVHAFHHVFNRNKPCFLEDPEKCKSFLKEKNEYLFHEYQCIYNIYKKGRSLNAEQSEKFRTAIIIHCDYCHYSDCEVPHDYFNQSDFEYPADMPVSDAHGVSVINHVVVDKRISHNLPHQPGSCDQCSINERAFFPHTLTDVHHGDILYSKDWLQEVFPNGNISNLHRSCEFNEGEKLGKGGNGTVYRCHLGETEVAIKYRKSYIRNENRIWSGLHHPNIIALLGVAVVVEEEFSICQIMPCMTSSLKYELLNVGPLCNALPHSYWLIVYNTFYLLKNILSGLIELHRQNICWNDLKAANILFKMKCHCSGLFYCRCQHDQNKPIVSDIYSFGCFLIKMFLGYSSHRVKEANLASLHEKNSEKFHPESELALSLIELKDMFKNTDEKYPIIYEIANIADQCLQPECNLRPSAMELREKVLSLSKVL